MVDRHLYPPPLFVFPIVPLFSASSPFTLTDPDQPTIGRLLIESILFRFSFTSRINCGFQLLSNLNECHASPNYQSTCSESIRSTLCSRYLLSSSAPSHEVTYWDPGSAKRASSPQGRNQRGNIAFQGTNTMGQGASSSYSGVPPPPPPPLAPPPPPPPPPSVMYPP
ncbi:unnamed protein product [Lactuca virosa]|uniref:Uncharacterized protein n=1 Tax=Lactuca virosa TaxID=75947 RepID=A0AAU9NQG5_9ASTR|nr:unnamed protein product [Lactuca virosa]